MANTVTSQFEHVLLSTRLCYFWWLLGEWTWNSGQQESDRNPSALGPSAAWKLVAVFHPISLTLGLELISKGWMTSWYPSLLTAWAVNMCGLVNFTGLRETEKGRDTLVLIPTIIIPKPWFAGSQSTLEQEAFQAAMGWWSLCPYPERPHELTKAQKYSWLLGDYIVDVRPLN